MMRRFVWLGVSLACVASFLVVRSSPASAVTDQFTLFDATMNHNYNKYWHPAFSAPADWTSPSNYAGGRVYLRIQVISKPSSKPIQAQICMWRSNYTVETCSGLSQTITDEGTYWVDLGTPNTNAWWKKNGNWDWTIPFEAVRLMIKDQATQKLLLTKACGTSCYTGGDIADHTPISISSSMVVVARNAVLDPPAGWTGCPQSWNPAKCPTAAGTAPNITVDPSSANVVEGQTATFSVTATGSPTLQYQWRRGTTDIPGATGSSYTTPPTTLADDGATYSVRVSNTYGDDVSASAVLSVRTPTVTSWFSPERQFRVHVAVSANGTARLDKVADVQLNFSQILASLGKSGLALDPNSLLAVEVNSQGNIVDDAVPFQFDPATDFHPATNAAGTLVLLTEGSTGANAARHYDLYFDVAGESFSPPTFAPLVTTTDGVADAGQSSIRVVTAAGTWYYHKQGGGFSSLVDASGNDWLNYNTTVGSAGSYRGVPNAVHPAGHFHPGATTSTTTLLSSGPLKSTFVSTTSDGWRARWDIYPTYATMTMEAKPNAPYWFLYEGTPGGSIDANDFVLRSGGSETPLATAWTADLPGKEWASFADRGVNRSLFVAHHEQDSFIDSHWLMENNMTVFGFGRGTGVNKYLVDVPQHFTVGLVDVADASVESVIDRSVDPLSVTTGPAEEYQSDPVVTDKAVLISGGATAPVGDRPIVQRLTSLGFTVVVVDDDTLNSTTAHSTIESATVVVIASSVVPAKVPAWLASAPVPLMNNEGYANVVLKLGTKQGEKASQTTVNVVGSGSLAAGASGSTVVSSSAPFSFATPTASAQVIARVQGSSTQATFFAYEQGGTLTAGSAPARRVGFLLGYDTPSRLNQAGWAMFDAAITWLAG